MTDLPHFRKSSPEYAQKVAEEMLTNPFQTPPKTHLIRLIAYEDNHFRAVFNPAYFILPEGETAPSKSQWNTFKKRIKRHHPAIFIFKDHGETTHEGQRVFYIDFGFFADPFKD